LTLTLTPLSPFPLVLVGDPLDEQILHALKLNGMTLGDGDILALAQKIVSKSEGRLVNLETVLPSPSAIDLDEKIESRLFSVYLRNIFDKLCNGWMVTEKKVYSTVENLIYPVKTRR